MDPGSGWAPPLLRAGRCARNPQQGSRTGRFGPRRESCRVRSCLGGQEVACSRRSTPSRCGSWSRLRRALGRGRDEIDALNVFPVADGDTGTNLHLTWSPAAAALDGLPARRAPRRRGGRWREGARAAPAAPGSDPQPVLARPGRGPGRRGADLGWGAGQRRRRALRRRGRPAGRGHDPDRSAGGGRGGARGRRERSPRRSRDAGVRCALRAPPHHRAARGARARRGGRRGRRGV